jgi:amino acid transporter
MNLIDKVMAYDLDLNLANSGTNNFSDIANLVSKWVGALAGIIAFFYLLYSGILYLTAGGNAEQAKKAQQGILNAIIGLVIIFLAYVIVSAVVGQLNARIR